MKATSSFGSQVEPGPEDTHACIRNGQASSRSFDLDGVLQAGDFLAVPQKGIGAPVRPGLPAIRRALPTAEDEPRRFAGFEYGLVFVDNFAVRRRYADPLL